MIELRQATVGEVPGLVDIALRMVEYSPAPQMRNVEPPLVRSYMHLAQLTGRLYVYGDFAILVDVGSDWYTSKRYLIEQLIWRVSRDHGNTVDSAIEKLDFIARLHGCVAVAAGDTQVGYMAPRYLAAGFQPLGTQYYKEIP